MSKRFRFSQGKIEKLSPPDKGRVDYYDVECPKLSCRISHTGNKSFVVIKKNEVGKVQRITLGRFPDLTVYRARLNAIEVLSEIGQGIDPMAGKRKRTAEKISLTDALESYLSERDLKPYTIQNYRYKLKLGFSDWLSQPASQITEEMVLKRHKLLSQKGKTTANTTMRVLRLTLNYAHAIGAVDTVATNILSKARLWHKNNRKDRVIPSNQLQAWHKAVEAAPNYKAKIYLLMLLYMGFRSSEALTLEWSNINLKSKTITLLDTKNGSDHTLPIPSPLLPYIKTLKDLTGQSRWLFTGKKDNHMQTPRNTIEAITQETDIEFSPHDCRRTFATIAEAVNLPLTMIKRLMNHVTTNDVTGGYIVTEEETLRKAINKVADYIQARVTQEGNVIKIRTRK